MRGKTLKIAYNNLSPYFRLDEDGSIDDESLEYYYLETFLSYSGVKPEFINANMTWGSMDKETGIWNGVVGLVSKY